MEVFVSQKIVLNQKISYGYICIDQILKYNMDIRHIHPSI